jgi:hypothetical protein
VLIGFIWRVIWANTDIYDYGNQLPGSVKDREVFDMLFVDLLK